MHDGGVHVATYLNGKLLCNSEAEYGTAGSSTAVFEGKEWSTLSKMTECVTPTKVKKGDTLNIEAAFDHIKHPL
jgi:hypothetical protein